MPVAAAVVRAAKEHARETRSRPVPHTTKLCHCGAVVDFLCLVLDGVASEVHDLEDEGEDPTDDTVPAYELAYGAFLALTSGPFAADIRTAMCEDVARYALAWRVLLLCPSPTDPSRLCTLRFITQDMRADPIEENIISRYLSRMYVSFLESSSAAATFLEQVDRFDATSLFFSRLRLPAMARFLDFFFDTALDAHTKYLHLDTIQLVDALFDADSAMTAASLIQGSMSKAMCNESRANDLLKIDMYENDDVAPILVDQTFVELSSLPLTSINTSSALDALTAMVRAHDDGCVTMGAYTPRHDCPTASVSFFKVLVQKIPACVVCLEHNASGSVNIHILQVIALLGAMIRLECAFVDAALLEHRALHALVRLFFACAQTPMVVTALGDIFASLLLHKHPVTNELQSYRRRPGDLLRREFLDRTGFFKRAMVHLDSLGDAREDAVPVLLLLFNVAQRSPEKITAPTVQKWIAANLPRLNVRAFGKVSGPFEAMADSRAVEQEVLASPKSGGTFDCDGFEIEYEDDFSADFFHPLSPFKITDDEDDALSRFLEEGSKVSEKTSPTIKFPVRVPISPDVASARHSERMKIAAKRFSEVDSDEEGDEPMRRGGLQKMLSSPGRLPTSLPSLKFSSSDEEDDDGMDPLSPMSRRWVSAKK